MSYGAYFATQPSTRTYVDTSQPLNGYGGFGAAEGSDSLLAIYDGVAGLGSAPGGCGCAGTRGTLSGLRGFGNEVLPDGSIPPIEPIASSLNLKTAFVALLVVGSFVAVGAFLLGPKPMRANGKRRGRKMRANGRRVGTRSMPTRRKGAAYVSTYCNFAHDLKTGRPRRHECIVIPPAALRAERDGDFDRANKIMQDRRYGLRRNGAPAYLLSKHGKTTKRQAHAAAHYLAEARWHGGPKRTAHWSGKHLAHKRFNTNGKRPRIMSGYGFVLDEMRAPTAWRTAINDSWEIQQVRRPSRPAKFLGTRSIDGSRCNVFLLSSGKVIAQQTQYGHAPR